MAQSVNKVILVGHLGKDPESRSMASGGKIVSLTIATSQSWNDRATNERKERTEWHRVVVFNEWAADFCERYLVKGHKVYLEGSLQTRKWTDQAGQDKYTTEVIVDKFKGEVIKLTDDRGQNTNQGSRTPDRASNSKPTNDTPSDDPYELDDQIPF